MKTILIPVDYSPCAYNAVHYAIQMAKIIHANIHLCHAIAIPELSPISGMVAWPLEDYEMIKADADGTLLAYIQELRTEHVVQFEITFSTEMLPIKEMVKKLVGELKPELMIMGMSGAGSVERFLLGSTSKDLIEKTTVPTLLIPKHIKYDYLKKIAFATDLSETDIYTIHSLARLFCLYNPEILLTNINNRPSDFHDPDSESNVFLRQVTGKINYSKIYFRHIKEGNIENGLKWLTEHDQIDMLCMIHRQHRIFYHLLKGSHTQKMAKIIELPLLVMPEVDYK